LFATESSKANANYILHNNPASLIISNTTTWMGGRCNITKVTADTCGVVEAETGQKPKDQSFLRT